MRSCVMFHCLLLFIFSMLFAGRTEQLAAQPIAHYSFEQGAEDVTGNGFDGTFLGDAYVEGGYLYLDGDDDAVAIPFIGAFQELTYSMWIYPWDDLSVMQFSGGVNTDNWSQGAVHFKVNNGVLNVGINGLGADVVGVTPVEMEEWSHIALTVSETEISLYLNGFLEAVSGIAAPIDLTVGGATLGAWTNGGNVEREMSGMMDEFLVYDVALSAEEIDSLARQDITAVLEKNLDNTTKTFNLAQSYPNPFNPTTTIAYTLNVNSQVKLSVYDILGKEVAVLVDGNQSVGNYKVEFSGADLTSGIYFYRLETADRVITRKMTLVK